MSDERLELVTDFASLRAGMIVVIRACGWCEGADHRGLLVRPWGPHVSNSPTRGPERVDAAWEVAPRPVGGGHTLPLIVSARAVEMRRVFRVVDGLDPAAEETQRRRDDAAAWGRNFERLGR